jgi:hypothetical protein
VSYDLFLSHSRAPLAESNAHTAQQTFGISRNGSGSQLMVYVLAMERGWHPQRDVQFAVKGDFKSTLCFAAVP